MTNAGLNPGDKAPNLPFQAQDQVVRHLYNQFCAKPVALIACVEWPGWMIPSMAHRPGIVVIAERGAEPSKHLSTEDDVYLVEDRSQIVRQLGANGLPKLIFLDSNHCVEQTWELSSPEHLAKVLADVSERLLALDLQPVKIVQQAAPVLTVRSALEPSFCDELIAHHETTGAEPSGVYKMIDGKSVYVTDGSTKVRTECIIDKSPLLSRLESRMQRRVLPEIHKCFQFAVTRYEGFKVVCYEADSGGHFVAHRDNDGPDTAHRRFALTVNLNHDAYSGGYLSFPEYGATKYATASGTAIVFSCSMAHEVTPVTKGRRFALISFFYGEGDQLRPADFDR